MDLSQDIERARAGDQEAFRRLIEPHATLAYHLALRHCGDPDLALEGRQEGWLKAWRSLDGFRGDGRSFRAWLLRIVVNASRDRARAESIRSHQPLEIGRGDERRPRPLPDPSASPEARAETADVGARLAWALDQLSPEHREIVLLDHQGYDYAEIASILEIARGTVKSRLSRARAHMRTLLAEPNGEPAPAAERSRGR